MSDSSLKVAIVFRKVCIIMTRKRLIEIETINKDYKSIETQLSLLEKYPIKLGNEHQVKVMKTSIEYLEESMNLLKPFDYDFKEMKRNAYSKYKTEKQLLEKMKKENALIEEIKQQESKVNSYLRLYLAYKGS